MVRGRQKQMVVIRTHASRFYEEAYFVLRDGLGFGNGQAESTMMAEANRILDESMLMPQPRRPVRFAWRTFLVGTFAGAVLCAAVFFLLRL